MVGFIKNRVAEFIKQKEQLGFKFAPSHDFYDKIGIKQKRFGIIYRNEQVATVDELNKIAAYFGFNLMDLIESAGLPKLKKSTRKPQKRQVKRIAKQG